MRFKVTWGLRSNLEQGDLSHENTIAIFPVPDAARLAQIKATFPLVNAEHIVPGRYPFPCIIRLYMDGAGMRAINVTSPGAYYKMELASD